MMGFGMKLTADEIVDEINNQAKALKCEIKEMSGELNDFDPAETDKDYRNIIRIYEQKRIAHNNYLMLLDLLSTIDAMEREKYES